MLPQDSSEQLREKYKVEFSLRMAFQDHLKSIIENILATNNHPFLSVIPRIKTEDSFVAKAKRQGKNYSNPLDEITDLTGIRILFEYKDEAQKAEEELRQTLIIDEKNSHDTRQESPETEFGYSAIHLIASLPQQLSDKFGCLAFGDRKFEIQIRTSLEDAWATKSRDIFYDRSIAKEYRRGLNRLAALLEIADETFLTLRNKLKPSYSSIESHDISHTLLSTLDAIDILKADVTIKQVVHALASTGLNIYDSARNEFAKNFADILFRQGVLTKKAATEHLQKMSNDIIESCSLYMHATKMNSYAKDSLLVAALAIIDNGDISAQEYCKDWHEKWREGFLKATNEYQAKRKKP